MFTDADMRIANALHAERIEAHENEKRLAEYLQGCENWAANYGRGPKPAIPFAVDSSLSYDGPFLLTVFETTRRLTEKKPEEFLPKHLLPSLLVQQIGAEIKHMPGCFAFTGTGAYPADGEVRELDGLRVQFKLAFFGLQGYWERLP